MTADTWRDQIASALVNHEPVYKDSYLSGAPPQFDCDCGWIGDPEVEPDSGHRRHVADAVMSILHAAVAEARADTAEAIARAVWNDEQKCQAAILDDPTSVHLNGRLAGLQRARDIARQHGKDQP